MKNGRFAFLSPSRGLRATYDVYLRLTGKRVADFLLVLIGLSSLGVVAEALYERISIENRRFRSNGDSLTQNFRGRVHPLTPTNHSYSHKTRPNDLSYKNLDRTFFGFVTIHAFDRRTDSFLVARPRCIQRGKNHL